MPARLLYLTAPKIVPLCSSREIREGSKVRHGPKFMMEGRCFKETTYHNAIRAKASPYVDARRIYVGVCEGIYG
jgi:hypothetical protein